MKILLSLVLALVFGLLLTPKIFAQDQVTGAAQEAANLRTQLIEVQARQADLQARLGQLDEASKPENIERAMAGIGSTRPEELREQRRRELTIERDGVRRQLDLLETSRQRLESAIQVADNRAYQESAQGFTFNPINAISISSVNPRRLKIASVTFFSLVALASLIVFLRRR